MIRLTDIAGTTIYVNPDLIEKMELVPDTVLTMTTAKRLVVRDTPEDVIARIVAFKQECNNVEHLREGLVTEGHRHHI